MRAFGGGWPWRRPQATGPLSLRASSTHLPVLLVFAVLALVMTFPLVLDAHRAFVADQHWYDALLNSWILSYDVKKLASGPLGLFDANIFFPHARTLAYSEHLLLPSLLGAPLTLAGLSPALTHNALLIAAIALTGFCSYLLCFDVTRKRLPSVLGGLAVGFHSFYVHEWCHLQVAFFFFVPLAFIFLRRSVAGPTWRNALLFGLSYLLCSLSCIYYAMYSTVAFAVYFMLRLRPSMLRPLARSAVKLCAAAAAVFALNIPLAIPYVRVQREMGYKRSAAMMDSYAIRPQNYFCALRSRHRLWGRFIPCPGPPLNQPHFPGFVVYGLCLVPAAAIGLRAARRRRGPAAEQGALPAEAWTFLAFALLMALFSLGPHVHIEARPLFAGPYKLLLDLVPGFSALRYPGRFGMFAALGLAVCAASSLGWVMDRLGGRTARTMAAALSAALICELWISPVKLRFAPPASSSGAYRWLREAPAGTAVMELPLKPYLGNKGIIRDSLHEYHSAYHMKPIFNGHSAVEPPLYRAAAEVMEGFPSSRSAALLGRIGVTHVIVHYDQYEPADAERIRRRLREEADLFEPAGDFLTEAVFSVAPPPAAPALPEGERIGVAAVSASTNPKDGRYTADLRSETSWSTRRPMRVGDWIELDLGAAQPVCGVELSMGNHAMDYPRSLKIELAGEGRAFEEVFREEGIVPVEDMIRNPADVRVKFVFPPRTARKVRLVLLGGHGKYWLTIAEAAVLVTRKPPQ